MHARTIDDDCRFKLRKAAISDWMSKTLESDRIQERRSKTIQGPFPQKGNTPMLSYTYQPTKSIDERISLTKFKPKKNKLKSSIPKRIQHLILNQGLNKTTDQHSPPRQNRFTESFNNFVFNYKPRITNSIQQQPQTFKTLEQQITKSLDYSSKHETKSKKVPHANTRINRQFKAIVTKMKLLLDTYKVREHTLLQYISKLQQEIHILKQRQ